MSTAQKNRVPPALLAESVGAEPEEAARDRSDNVAARLLEAHPSTEAARHAVENARQDVVVQFILQSGGVDEAIRRLDELAAAEPPIGG